MKVSVPLKLPAGGVYLTWLPCPSTVYGSIPLVIVLLLLFLTYPLGLGTWLGFTDTKIGRPGQWIGIENYQFLWGDEVTRLALFNTLFYTVVASVLKFFLGLWLAILLNERIPFKSFFRAAILLPYIVPTALSAIAFWWMFDAQFSVISWVLTRLGWIHGYIDFLGDPWLARLSTIAANIWRGVPFVAICLLAGLQTISPSLYEAAALDGATPWQRFRFIVLPLILPVIAYGSISISAGSLTTYDIPYIYLNYISSGSAGGGPGGQGWFYLPYMTWMAFDQMRMGYAAAMGWLVFVVAVVVTAIQLKLFNIGEVR